MKHKEIVERRESCIDAFIKATQIKRDESDSQNLTKVLYHQNFFTYMFRQISCFTILNIKNNIFYKFNEKCYFYLSDVK